MNFQMGSTCFCGNKYGSYGPANCTTPCSGNANETCGSWMANSVYSGTFSGFILAYYGTSNVLL